MLMLTLRRELLTRIRLQGYFPIPQKIRRSLIAHVFFFCVFTRYVQFKYDGYEEVIVTFGGFYCCLLLLCTRGSRFGIKCQMGKYEYRSFKYL